MDSWTGLILSFDSNSHSRMQELQRLLLDNPKIQGSIELVIPPHITLFEHPNLLKDDLLPKLNHFCQEQKSFQVVYSSIAYFPSTKVLFLNPKESRELHEFRQDLMSVLKNNSIDTYRPIQRPWIPHTTLLMDHPATDLAESMKEIQQYLDLQIDNPFIATVSAMHLFSYPPYISEEIFPL